MLGMNAIVYRGHDVGTNAVVIYLCEQHNIPYQCSLPHDDPLKTENVLQVGFMPFLGKAHLVAYNTYPCAEALSVETFEKCIICPAAPITLSAICRRLNSSFGHLSIQQRQRIPRDAQMVDMASTVYVIGQLAHYDSDDLTHCPPMGGQGWICELAKSRER